MPRAKLNPEDLRACSLAWHRYPRRNRQKASKAANRRRPRAKLNLEDLRACSLAWHRYPRRNRQKVSKAANRRRVDLNPEDLRACSLAWHRYPRRMRPQRQRANQREVRRRERRGGHRVPRGPFVLRMGRALRLISSAKRKRP